MIPHFNTRSVYLKSEHMHCVVKEKTKLLSSSIIYIDLIQNFSTLKDTPRLSK